MSTWDGIDEFIAVAEASSFSKAARAIGMSPTHVSRSVSQLEVRLQALLFNRTTRFVELTDDGQVFFDQCRRIAQDRDEAVAMITDRGEPTGELRVTCSTAIGERFVVPVIRRLAVEHSNLRVSIELTNRIVDLIGEGIDLAVRTGEITDNRLLGSLVAQRRLYTCASPEYLARRGEPRSVDDLANHDRLIGTSSVWHYQVAGERVHHRPSSRFRCNSGNAVMDACLSGMGICQLPEIYVLPYITSGGARLILEEFRPEDEPIWAVYPRRRHLHPKIRVAVEVLKRDLRSTMGH
ncbi:LysR family transcriptional regulator [Sphingomonas sp. BK235]|uniref:LysR family transcriptional regulator n=1 Tax=Sphingomonas sp. BK235 TaxID=2512131 RepID=UPI00104496EC|nr:LysR family transcriptional regulator [Sphingomonas sp. BK235]TCP32428.1 LysR family transcriptional regulator [Sphingomonas sp. BK235]